MGFAALSAGAVVPDADCLAVLATLCGVCFGVAVVAGTAEDKAQTGAGQGATVGILCPGAFIERNMPAINESS